MWAAESSSSWMLKHQLEGQYHEIHCSGKDWRPRYTEHNAAQTFKARETQSKVLNSVSQESSPFPQSKAFKPCQSHHSPLPGGVWAYPRCFWMQLAGVRVKRDSQHKEKFLYEPSLEWHFITARKELSIDFYEIIDLPWKSFPPYQNKGCWTVNVPSSVIPRLDTQLVLCYLHYEQK